MNLCKKCNITLTDLNWYACVAKQGRRICKSCIKEQSKKWITDNKDHYKTLYKHWAENNKDKIKEYYKKHKERHKKVLTSAQKIRKNELAKIRNIIKATGRPVFFNNNGIHPGEPEGVDACMAMVRDLCYQPELLAALGKTVLLFVPPSRPNQAHQPQARAHNRERPERTAQSARTRAERSKHRPNPQTHISCDPSSRNAPEAGNCRPTRRHQRYRYAPKCHLERECPSS